MLFKFALSLPLLVLVACGGQRGGVHYGQTTKAALTSEKGEPLAEETPLATNKDLSVLIYEDDQKYQVQNDIVVAGFRRPTESEKSLLYWKHKFKDCSTSEREIKQSDNHLKAEKEYSCPKEGLTVIYDPNIDKVTRIVEQAHEE